MASAAQREAQNRHYAKNKAYYLDRNRQKKAAMRAHIAEAKRTPCMDCGKSYPPYVMDFDHRDPSTKISLVSTMPRDKGWATLKAEIEKCDVVCANCHRERTHGRISANPVPKEKRASRLPS